MKHYEEFVRLSVFSSERDTKEALSIYALGLNGESGEVAEVIKKWLDRGKVIDGGMLLELGDVLWYLTALSLRLGYTLDDVAKANIEKLLARRTAGTHGHSQVK